MNHLLEPLSHNYTLNLFFLQTVLLISMVLVARTVVAGARLPSIFIVVVFGIILGFVMVKNKVATSGLEEFPITVFTSKTITIALTAFFFMGGQKLKKLFFNAGFHIKNIATLSNEEVVLETNSTQFFLLLKVFLLLIGIRSVYKLLTDFFKNNSFKESYLLLIYLSIVLFIISFNKESRVKNTRKALIEIVAILGVLLLSMHVVNFIKPIIAIPQIFFVILISTSLGIIFSNWKFGPTVNSLLFSGIPIVLAGNFMIIGSRVGNSFKIGNITTYGFMSLIFFMFSGMAILMFLNKVNHVRKMVS